LILSWDSENQVDLKAILFLRYIFENLVIVSAFYKIYHAPYSTGCHKYMLHFFKFIYIISQNFQMKLRSQ
jgi:hypothetical protein